jgi:hypothetical protein
MCCTNGASLTSLRTRVALHDILRNDDAAIAR